jgi:putative tryptophan/tyrosine transport system substrate-binding protein
MNRREMIALLGGAAIWPGAARGQPMPVIGYLAGASFDLMREIQIASFHRGLADTGFVEGRNVAIEYRFAQGHNDQLPALAAELVRRQATVIVAAGTTPGALAVKAATQTIPCEHARFLLSPVRYQAGILGGSLSYIPPGTPT